MTVRELIEKLQTFDGDHWVRVETGRGPSPAMVTAVEFASVPHEGKVALIRIEELE